jgi:drug/metabolite transporter (DMT)-like permease
VYALTYTNASTVALILGATPIFVALIAFAIGLERLHAGFWLAAVVSFGGVALIALGKRAESRGASRAICSASRRRRRGRRTRSRSRR